MPIFTYLCEDNDHEYDHIFTLHETRPRYLPCPECLSPSERLFRPSQVITMEGYRTDAGDGTMVEIRTPKQEEKYAASHGMFHATDNDIARMQGTLSGSKNRRAKAAEARRGPISEAYERAEAASFKQGKEFKREMADARTPK